MAPSGVMPMRISNRLPTTTQRGAREGSGFAPAIYRCKFQQCPPRRPLGGNRGPTSSNVGGKTETAVPVSTTAKGTGAGFGAVCTDGLWTTGSPGALKSGRNSRTLGTTKEARAVKDLASFIAGQRIDCPRLPAKDPDDKVEEAIENILGPGARDLSQEKAPEHFLPLVPPDKDCPDSAAGAELILRKAAWALLDCPPTGWAAFHQRVRILVQGLHDVAFPSTLRTHRSAPKVLHALVGARAVNEVCYLVRFPMSERAKMVKALLLPGERLGLEQTKLNHSRAWRSAILRILLRQRCAIRGGSGFDCRHRVGMIYSQGSNQVGYLGFVHEWRDDDARMAGFPQRDVEHVERTTRSHRPGAKARRYKAWRRGQRGTGGSLVLRRSWRVQASVMEVQGINGLDVHGNAKKQIKKRGRWKENKRRRLPPWASGSMRHAEHARRKKCAELQQFHWEKNDGRSSSSEGRPTPVTKRELADWDKLQREGPLDSEVARATRRRRVRKLQEKANQRAEDARGKPAGKGRRNKIVQPGLPTQQQQKGSDGKPGARKVHEMTPNEEEKWKLSFHDAYVQMQQHRQRRGDGQGPVFILAKGMKRLLVLFLAKTKGRVDWDDVERAWGSSFPELALHRLLEKLQASGRERTAWRKIHERMRERQIPSKTLLSFKIAPSAPKDVALREVKKQITGAGLDADLTTWLVRNTSVSHSNPRTFFNLRNAGAVVRAGKLEDAKKLMKERQEEIVSGSLLERVPGCAKIPIRTTPHEGVEEIRSASKRMRGMIERLGTPPLGWKPKAEKWIGSGVRFVDKKGGGSRRAQNC